MNLAHVTGACWKRSFSDSSSWQNLVVCCTKQPPSLLLLNLLVHSAQDFMAYKFL